MSDMRRDPDSNARRRALDPAGSFIVQAPAGSGKTELLTQRYLVLLAHVSEPEEVVAITFTRKAASEMRNRVLGALEAAARTERPGLAHKAQTWDLARAVLARDNAQGWDLIANPMRLRIGTIDSFCASLTRQMPLLSRFGAQPAMVEDAGPLFREAARQTLALLEGGSDWTPAVARLLAHLDNHLARVEELLAAMLARRDQWLRHIADGADHATRRQELERALASVIRDALRNLHAAAPAATASEIFSVARFAATQLGEAGESSTLDVLTPLTDWPGSEAGDAEAWRALAGMLLTKDGEWRKKVDKRDGFPASDKKATAAENAQRADMKQRMLTLLAGLEGEEEFRTRLADVRELPPSHYDDRQWEVMEALYDLLPVAVAQLRLVFIRHGEVDFTEVAQGALRALGDADQPTDLALRLDYRIHHLLVDEFQDTSVSQYELLALLTAGWQPGDGRSLFVVGDPMQSIYRFRQAEVGLYLRARHEGIGQVPLEPLALQVNFRSQAGIVDWVNDAFVHVLPASEDIAGGAVPYASAIAHHDAFPGHAVTVHPFLSDDRPAEALEVVRIIESAIAEAPDEKIAVLVRSRAHLAEIVLRLKEAGRRFKAVEVEALGHRPVIQDLLALTRALTHLADRVAWLSILRAPWCGLTLADLEALCGDDPRASLWTLMQNEERIARLSADGRKRLLRLRAVLAEAWQQRGRLSLPRLVEGAWLSLGGPACVQEETDLEDAQVYFDLLGELEESGDLGDQTLLAQRVAGLFALPDVSASDRIQLMTIHKAKGLEFHTVIVPGLGRLPRNEEARLLLWMERPRGDHDSRESADLLLAPIRASGADEDPIYRYLQRLDRQKGTYEDGRLLYVAATRAMHRLHLLGHARVDKNDNVQPPDRRSLLYLLWPVVRETYSAARAAGGAPAAATETQAAMPQTITCLKAGWRAPEPSPTVRWQAGLELAVPEEAPAVEFEWASETIRHVGTVVHRVLQQIGREGAKRWDGTRVERIQPAFEQMLTRLGVPTVELAPAVVRVRQALQKTLADRRGGWILDPGHSEARCEFALTVMENNQPATVVMDRTFVDADGVRWIIDYKTSSHEGGGLDAFLDREQERYRAQLERYARLLRTLDNRPIRLGLYFPLLGGWREWEAE